MARDFTKVRTIFGALSDVLRTTDRDYVEQQILMRRLGMSQKEAEEATYAALMMYPHEDN